jgi:hypothetical protein
MSDSSRHNLYYVAESTYGTTPTASPAFLDLRHTACSLGLTKTTAVSEELHQDRQIRDFRHGTKNVAGDVGLELSYGSFDAILEAILGGTWATDILKAGTTRRSFSLLRHFSDLASGDKPYHLFTGCEFNTLSLTVPASGIVTGSIGVLGKGMSPLADLSALTTPTTGDPTTTEPFDSFTGTVTEGGSGIAIVTEISLNLDNGLAARYAIGSAETLQPSIGRSNLTGSITAFFEDATLLEKFLNETESALVFTLLDPAGNSYTVTLPRIKYTGGQPDVSGQGAITLSLPFQAIRDSSEASNIKIVRAAA